MRMDFDPVAVGARDFYKLLNSVVVPRPIAWISSTSPEGVDNLAPHSYFTVACTDPPVVQFTSVGHKDSLVNIEATGEFVVNLVPEALFEEANATGTDFPHGVSEFEAVGLEREASTRVLAPRVARSPVALECVLHQTVPVAGCTLVLGRVVHAAVAASVLSDGRPAIGKLKPLSRLGGDEWGLIGEIREIARIPHQQWPGHFRPARSSGTTRR
ncbi:MAG: flavin reductase family protein [Actinomycetota bacterium]|nr:flavin reductase family protein [Actinomycetota bacterium]